MTELVFHPAAQLEYRHAIEWYSEQGRPVAERFVAEVETAIESIRLNPDRSVRLDATYRAYLLQKYPYYLAFRLKNKQIEIVTIRHASRDQADWKDR